MSNLFTNLLTHLTLFFYTQSKYLLLVIVFGLCAMGLVVGHAQVIAKCNVVTPKITMTSVLNLGSFLPIIPEVCAKKADGSVNFISPGYFTSVMLRGYGFIVSLVFYSFTPIIIFAGIVKMLSGTDFALKEFNANKIAENAATGLAVAFLAYAGVFTLLAILRVKPEVTGANLDSFFSF